MLRARAIDWQEARVMKSVKSLSAAFASSIACAALLLWTPTGFAQPQKQTDRVDKMSSAGKRAAAAVNKIAKESAPEARTALAVTEEDEDRCINEPDCEGEEEGDAEEAPGGQAEVSIAVDATGQHIVIGYNDTRGFSENPISLSGVLYSEDGGKTFVDGGRLPTPGTDVIGTTRLPQVFGDPEVKYLGACTFVYSSIMIKKFSATTAVQTMSLHRSTDCGKTWQGPFEITAATNPNGIVEEDEPADAADKEFMDVDPDTGRLIISWSNFTPAAPGGVEIRTSFSDNAKSGSPPTWSTGTIVAATADDGQSSCPRFAAGNNNAYVAWRRFPFPGTFGGLGNTIGFARSLNNGATWQAPVNTSNEFFTMDQVLGNDRVNTSPSLAVDNSYGKYRGNIYLVYANNNSGDGADIVFQRSTDKGVTFSAPLELNAGPGEDRPQWFPWVTVDTTTGRVHVFYYDQRIDTSGDLTEVSYLFSDDGGKHWSAPVPLTKRPFHAGHGNDTGQPNLGDYNQAVAQHGDLFASYALASPPPGGFVDGQPTSTQLTVPDVEFKRHSQGSKLDLNSLPLSIDVNDVSFSDASGNGNGFADPGETIRVNLSLENYTVNPLNDATAQGVIALLLSDTPGVQVRQPLGVYGNISSGQSKASVLSYQLRLAPTFDPGTAIELRLEVLGLFDGWLDAATLRHTLLTGTPVATTVLSENFDSVAPGTLPAGWTSAHGGGANVVPWVTSNTFCSSSNAAFHANANDNGTGNPTRWERLFSPLFAIPADSDYVTLDFDVCTDTEFDPSFNIQAFDGLTLRIFDNTPGFTPRSVLVEAYADEITTGGVKHFPKHLPRNNNPAYLQDMSVWAGDSQGIKHVHMRLPGMAGTVDQLRFEFTQDGAGTCLDVGGGPICGVSVDNLVLRSVKATAAPVPAGQ
jgi:hypothetical protein